MAVRKIKRRAKPRTDAEARNLVESRGKRMGKSALSKMPDVAKELDDLQKRNPFVSHPLKMLMRSAKAFRMLPEIIKSAEVCVYPTDVIDATLGAPRDKRAFLARLSEMRLDHADAAPNNLTALFDWAYQASAVRRQPYQRDTTLGDSCKLTAYAVADEDAWSMDYSQYHTFYPSTSDASNNNTVLLGSFSKTSTYLKCHGDRLFQFDRSDLIMAREHALLGEITQVTPASVIHNIAQLEKQAVRDAITGENKLAVEHSLHTPYGAAELLRRIGSALALDQYFPQPNVDEAAGAKKRRERDLDWQLRHMFGRVADNTERYCKSTMDMATYGQTLLNRSEICGLLGTLPEMLFLVDKIALEHSRSKQPIPLRVMRQLSLFDAINNVVPGAEPKPGDVVRLTAIPYGCRPYARRANAIKITMRWAELESLLRAVQSAASLRSAEIMNSVSKFLADAREVRDAKDAPWLRSHVGGMDGVATDPADLFDPTNNSGGTIRKIINDNRKAKCPPLDFVALRCDVIDSKTNAWIEKGGVDHLAYFDLYARYAEHHGQQPGKTTLPASYVVTPGAYSKLGAVIDAVAAQHDITGTHYKLHATTYTRELDAIIKASRMMSASPAQYAALAVSCAARLYKQDKLPDVGSTLFSHRFIKCLSSRQMMRSISSMGSALFDASMGSASGLAALCGENDLDALSTIQPTQPFNVEYAKQSIQFLLDVYSYFDARDARGKLTATYMHGGEISPLIFYAFPPLSAYWRENPDEVFGGVNFAQMRAASFHQNGSKSMVDGVISKVEKLYPKLLKRFCREVARWSTVEALVKERDEQQAIRSGVKTTNVAMLHVVREAVKLKNSKKVAG